MITHVFFDLDNTLIDRNKAYQKYLYTFFDQINKLHVWEKYKDEILVKDNYGYTSRKEFETYLIERFVREEVLQEYQQKYVVGDFVEPISSLLKSKLSFLSTKYTIGILTNGGVQNQQTKIKKAKLSTLFEKELIFISEKIGCKKPSKAVFQFIEQKMQLLSSECLIIGDDIVNDIEGGKKAGWNTIHTNSNQILHTIDELLK